jgi:hypothetical protein
MELWKAAPWIKQPPWHVVPSEVGLMRTYELRLADGEGRMSLIYRSLSRDDVNAIKALVPEDLRYELWDGMNLLEEGPPLQWSN